MGTDGVAVQANQYRDLLRREAELGGQVFGPVAQGGRREFFCLDKNTWIWHEEWVDQTGNRHTKTTRYDVRPTGILKAQSNGSYHRVSRLRVSILTVHSASCMPLAPR
jgi:hypothetical protein